MSTSTRHPVRPRGVTLHLLDTASLVKAAAEAYPLTEPGSTYRAGFEPYAVAEHDGRLYVVCNEGVGWEVTDSDPLVVDLYSERRGPDGGLKSFGMFPSVSVTLTAEEVRGYTTDTAVDLADHIRTFGGRLEANFGTWHRTLTA